MTLTVVVVAILIVVLIVWQAARHSQGTSKQAGLELDRLRKELQEVREEQKRLINDSAQRGTKISTDQVLKHVEDLKETYVRAGNEEAAQEVDCVIREFREQHGPEIPIDKAYALMKALEGKYGM